MKGFARREFQLMLLRRMADFQPGLVEQAYTALDATHKQYMAAHNRWVSMLKSKRAPRGLELYEAVLGPADSKKSVPFGDVTMTAHTWRLPGLWPDLRWEVLIGDQGMALNGWLVRADDSPIPPLETFEPWGCVVGDVVFRFPDAQQADPQIPSQWRIDLGDRSLWFVYGLLQKC